MPAFRFRLDQVLKYRTQLEDQARVELARVERERLREQERADVIRALLEEQEAKLAKIDLGNQGERWLLENYIKGQRNDLSITLMRVRNWNMAAEAARTELLKRSKDKKILEKLKAKQAESHVQEEKFREQQELDETATLRYKIPA